MTPACRLAGRASGSGVRPRFVFRGSMSKTPAYSTAFPLEPQDVERFDRRRVGRRFVQQLLLALQFVVPLVDHAVAVDLARTLHLPSGHLLRLEPAGVADELLHLTPLVLAAGDAQYFLALHPEHHLAAALRTV